MKIHFLGTAASEGIPNPYCSCELCERVRITKGKDIRTRSSVVVDDKMQIDISPEFSCQLLRDNVDARKITELLFTHTHPDHFGIGELYSRMEGFGHHIERPLNIYGNDIAISNCVKFLAGYTSRFKFNRLIPFVTVQSDGYRITPLLANHAMWEFCYVWFIEKDGKSLFYGHDSGWFPDLTWQWLAGRPIDLTVFECTIGSNGNNRTNNHMSIETLLSAKNKLEQQGCLNEKSKVIVSHISHNIKMNHHDFENYLAEYEIAVAYDGLKVIF